MILWPPPRRGGAAARLAVVGPGFPGVATNAEALAALDVVPAPAIFAELGPVNNWADMVSMSFTACGTNAAALLALKRTGRQHSQAPGFVLLRAVAPRCCCRSVAVVPFLSA